MSRFDHVEGVFFYSNGSNVFSDVWYDELREMWMGTVVGVLEPREVFLALREHPLCKNDVPLLFGLSRFGLVYISEEFLDEEEKNGKETA